MSTQRIALGVSYCGTGYEGWQSQRSGNTVQDKLEQALSQFADVPIRIMCAGRTDAGVHALMQVAHFDTDISRETNSWLWTLFMVCYMTVLAYAASFVTYQGGRLFGFA